MTDTFAGRVAPWRTIPNSVYFEDTVSTHEMLKRAQLYNWNVGMIGADEILKDNWIAPNNQYFTFRNSVEYPGFKQLIAPVKSKYQVLQNEDAFNWADTIIDGGGKWDTAGSFNNGSKVFGSLLIDEEEIVIDRSGIADAVNLYLLVSTSHDGSLPLQGSITPIRVRCQNTFQLALDMVGSSEVPQTFKIRHTSSAEFKVEAAREALRLSFKYAGDFNLLANKLYTRTVNVDKFIKILEYVYPKPPEENKAATTRWENTINLIHEIRMSPTNEGIRDTAWGAYNILTERLDWFRRTNKADSVGLAASGFVPQEVDKKNRLLRAVMAATA